jgi:hypothetical protein
VRVIDHGDPRAAEWNRWAAYRGRGRKAKVVDVSPGILMQSVGSEADLAGAGVKRASRSRPRKKP